MVKEAMVTKDNKDLHLRRKFVFSGRLLKEFLL